LISSSEAFMRTSKIKVGNRGDAIHPFANVGKWL
jgi:hypothetical protein